MKLRILGFIPVLAGASLFITGCPGKSSPNSPGAQATNTFTPLATATPSNTGTKTATSTSTGTPTKTPTPTPSSTPTLTATLTVTATLTPSPTPTNTATLTATSTPTNSPSLTPTNTPTNTATNTSTNSSTPTPCGYPGNTCTPTATFTATNIPFSASVTIGSGTLLHPSGVAYVSGGNLWVTDVGNNSLSEWTTAGSGPFPNITTFGPSLSFNGPFQVAVDPATGNLYVADRGNNRIEVFSSSGAYLTHFGSAQFTVSGTGPSGVAVNAAGTTVYAEDQGNQQCYAWSISSGPSYNYQFTFANSGSGSLSGDTPQLMHLDGSGNVWVATYTDKANEYDPSGNFIRSVGTVVNSSDVAVDNEGNIYIVDYGNPEIGYYSSSGTVLAVYGSTGNYNDPYGITFNDTYSDFYVTDYGGGQVVGF